MSMSLEIPSSATKADKYAALLPQIQALLTAEDDLIANLANLAAALHETFGFWWTGFYLAGNENLVLGPFQGPVACTRIGFGKGVCGTAYSQKSTIVVADVDQFPGHIACSAASKSEIVVPVIKNGEVKMVLDVDSEQLAHFDETDRIYLKKVAEMIAQKHY